MTVWEELRRTWYPIPGIARQREDATLSGERLREGESE